MNHSQLHWQCLILRFMDDDETEDFDSDEDQDAYKD